MVCGKVGERPYRQLLGHLQFADLARDIKVGAMFVLACDHSFLKLCHGRPPRSSSGQRQGRDQTGRERTSRDQVSRDRISRNQPSHLDQSDLFPDALHGMTQAEA
jgi:hypothetical protein